MFILRCNGHKTRQNALGDNLKPVPEIGVDPSRGANQKLKLTPLIKVRHGKGKDTGKPPRLSLVPSPPLSRLNLSETQSVSPVMRFQNLVFKLTLGVLAHAQSTPPEQCATGVHAILIRGQGPGDHLNVMVTIQNLVLQLIPGSSSVALPFKHGADDHRIAAADGAYMMQQYIREYIADCPDSKIFLHGYSLGGIVLMDGLCGTSSSWLFPVPALEPKYNKSVIAAVSYGEETFLPMQPWNIGTCTNGTGLYPRIHPEWCDPYKDSLRSYCDVGDVECCLTNPPGDNSAHFFYIVKYNMDVVHFIQRRLKETRFQ